MGLIKWLTQRKKREYTIQYTATGFMGNNYVAGIFNFKVSDREIKNNGLLTPDQYGFFKNYKKLSPHFPITNGTHKYIAKIT